VLRRSKENIRNFQKKIYRKAKQEKDFKFYSLYDKVCKLEYLEESYRRVRKNAGSPGVDGLNFETIEQNGLDDYLKEIQQELRTNKYKPSPVKRVYITKANGKLRPLGIPTIKDRIVQMSVKLVIEPIYEARFENNSYGFRPKRSAKDAIQQIRNKILKEQKNNVYDADISGYFDNIPHKNVMMLLRRDITDGKILKLIESWLRTPISDNGKLIKSLKGTPQGGVISPLLANIYMNELIKEVNRKGSIFNRNRVEIISYADDFVLLGKSIDWFIVDELKRLLKAMGLELNKEKSKRVNVFREELKFLGFSIRYEKIRHNKFGYFMKISPSKESVKRLRAKIRGIISKFRNLSGLLLALKLNEIMIGWFNYYKIDGITYLYKAKNGICYYLFKKLYKLHKRMKSQRSSRLCKLGVMEIYIKRFGLFNPMDIIELPVKA